MGQNIKAQRRGFTYDPVLKSLDLVVDGTRVNKFAGDSPVNLYADSTTQAYDIGTRLSVDDRVFRYCLAGGALNRQQAAGNGDQWSLTNEAPNQSASVGDTSFQVVNTTATKDLYKGGWVAIFTNRLQMRRVLSNDASDGTDTKIYIDGPLESAITADTTSVTGYKNMYADCRHAGSEWNTIVAVPVCTVAQGSYFWGQTWGPCYMRAIGTVPGATAYDREVYFGADGDAYGHIQAEGVTGGGYQRAGQLIPLTSSGVGDQFFMLQLAP